jgi:glycosyltransferase involved in cell wall biosynthesis
MENCGDSAVAVRVMEHPDLTDAPTTTPATDAPSRAPRVATMTHGNAASIDAALRALNATDVAVIQHEYGIYGGADGDEVLEVMRGLTVPSIAVLHTVLDNPTPGQRWVLEEVLRLANTCVVMSNIAMNRLRTLYGVDPAHVHVIPHGVTPPRVEAPHSFSLADAAAPFRRPVILTWGLLGPGKGIEWGIRSLTHLTHMHPRPIYRVIGQTHPKVIALEGEKYHDSLKALARDLGVQDSVDLQHDYVDPETLARHVAEASVVLLPYDSTAQITSGVLAEAIAAGKPVVATEFPHAVELLAGGAGTVVKHGDPRGTAGAIEQILTRPDLARSMSERGLEYGRSATWAAVGAKFRAIAHQIATEVPV